MYATDAMGSWISLPGWLTLITGPVFQMGKVLYSYHAPYWRALFPLAAALFMVVVARFLMPSRWAAVARPLIGTLGIGIALAAAIVIHGQAQEIASIVRSGQAQVLAGRVSGFRPGSGNQHRHEKLTLAGVLFDYVDYDGGPGFNRTAADGGPMRDGRCIRLRYYRDSFRGNRILKLEQLSGADSALHCR